MVLPELSLLRSGEGCWLTLNVIVSGASDARPMPSSALGAGSRACARHRSGRSTRLPPAAATIDAPRPPEPL